MSADASGTMLRGVPAPVNGSAKRQVGALLPDSCASQATIWVLACATRYEQESRDHRLLETTACLETLDALGEQDHRPPDR